MTAVTDLQMKWIASGYTARMIGADNPDNENSDSDSDFDGEAPHMDVVGNELIDLLPSVFPTEDDQPPYILDHGDLHGGNILVDPEAFAITGIIDWENACVIPHWRALKYPEILLSDGRALGEPMEELDGSTPFGLFEEDESEEVTEARDRLEKKTLRKYFDIVMSEKLAMRQQSSVPDIQKQKCHESIGDLAEATWPAARRWVTRTRKNGVYLEENEDLIVIVETALNSHNEIVEAIVDEWYEEGDSGVDLSYDIKASIQISETQEHSSEHNLINKVDAATPNSTGYDAFETMLEGSDVPMEPTNVIGASWEAEDTQKSTFPDRSNKEAIDITNATLDEWYEEEDTLVEHTTEDIKVSIKKTEIEEIDEGTVIEISCIEMIEGD